MSWRRWVVLALLAIAAGALLWLLPTGERESQTPQVEGSLPLGGVVLSAAPTAPAHVPPPRLTADASTAREVAIYVSVVDENGDPLQVEVMLVRDNEVLYTALPPAAAVPFAIVDPGEYSIAPSSCDGFVDEFAVLSTAVHATPPEAHAELRLRGAHELHGRVLNSPAGAGVADVHLRGVDGGKRVGGFAEPDGGFRMVRLPAGDYVFTARHELVGIAEVRLTLPRGEPLEVTLVPAVEVQVRVNSGGEPVRGALVGLMAGETATSTWPARM